jgi:phage FluMu gp28-like protein
MGTSARVEMFGTERIKAIYANMLEEDFQQEYECLFVDESTAWIPWEVIQRNQQPELRWWHAKTPDAALGMIDDILYARNMGQIEPVFAGGIDVGRKKDLSEMMMLGKTTTGQLPIRLSVSLDRVPFDEQERVFTEIINRLPFTQVLVDQNGIGAQLAENLARKTGRAEGVNFTNPSKELWAVEAKLQAERNNTPLPADREIAYQIHSIKKMVTAAKNNVFDTQKNEQHHADKFWAWALALWAGKENDNTAVFAPNPFADNRG